ncbi:phosphatidylinositol mannoside acyltransferase [Salinactinospora qingdaonensis]|uniref:Phosphatidylinositol mannoside acyltransferase n=1 Tax=Salinactinospora qingdaonensis TaxID=702744 RepID=A0ABP7FS36_9ACTN
MAERVAAAAYTLGWALVRRLPERLGRHAFAGIADAAWRRRTSGVGQLEANLERLMAAPVGHDQLRALSRAGMRSYLRYWYEMFRLPALSSAQLHDSVRAVGVERVEQAVASGRGVVAALPHMGNWDLAGAWITARGIPLTTVAQRLRPERLFDRFVAFRSSLGMEVLPLTGAANPFGTLARRLRSGRLVCLLADRDITESGVGVTFFGESARMPGGPALLAQRTGAALLPVSLHYEGRHMVIRVHEEIPVPAAGDTAAKTRAMTQELAHVFEAEISEHPQDWHMLQPIFTADLPGAEPAGRSTAATSPTSPPPPGQR